MIETVEGYLDGADGVRLYFRRLGSGQRTLVIPNGTYLLDDLEPLARDRTLLAYDLRHRGRSERLGDGAARRRGVEDDLDDLDALRRHLGLQRLDLMGHSYVGLVVVLYALRHPGHVARVVQLSPIEPCPGTVYAPHLSGADATRREVLAKLGELRAASAPSDPVERCRKLWSVLRPLYVTDPADAGRVDWGRCWRDP